MVQFHITHVQHRQGFAKKPNLLGVPFHQCNPHLREKDFQGQGRKAAPGSNVQKVPRFLTKMPYHRAK